LNGLRIFTQPGLAETVGGFQVFYSRRADGPYYRWYFEQGLKQWRAARVNAVKLSAGELSLSTWRSLPGALQKSLIDHYLE
jgi:hypothetical protein